jgi:hypothetical protein
VELLGLGGLLSIVPEWQVMTITYPDGKVLDALLLSRSGDTLRAAVPGDDDVRTFTLVNGAWISNECEQVKIEFAWQRSGQVEVPRESDCIYSMKLPSRFISMLPNVGEGDELAENISALSAEGPQVRIQRGRLHGRRLAHQVRRCRPFRPIH